MKYIGINGIVARIGQEIDFYGEIAPLKFDDKTLTPYVRICEKIKGRKRRLNMPLMPGDVIGVERNGEFMDVIFTGKDSRYRDFEYAPFGVNI